MPIANKKTALRPARRSTTSKKPVTKRTTKPGSVEDPSTGLTWCKDPIKVTSWADAKEKAEACRVGGYTDWRMPTIKELISIVDYDKRLPAIDTKRFNMPKDEAWPRFWSSSPVVGWPELAWVVFFNFGGVYSSGRNSSGFVRPVRAARPREYPGAVTFAELHTAFLAARRGKVPSANRLSFESRWIDHLLDLERRLNAGTWEPSRSTCFIARRPKSREIHAPDFADRVVHHWLVPYLEQIYEPRFIHDSFSNRAGKGTHAAVDRLQHFVRQVHSGQGGGWYLQLDVRNFFNSLHRPTLWRSLKPVLVRAGLPNHMLRAVHALLRRSPLEAGVRYHGAAEERASVPAHKRLENAGPGCGLPIGNLSSQFFANVYLDALDQFVKHTLKAPRYLRYVDDFVLVHQDREQLERWRGQIEAFLRDQLRLELKAEQKLRPIDSGIDFLGFVLYPTHKRVRRRVVGHAREALHAWEQRHVQPGAVRCTPAQLRELASAWSSYQGHFAHANTFSLQQGLHRRFPWLEPLTRIRRRFAVGLEGLQQEISLP
jgi:hypothetical protein